ncbi:hypothetical protein [Dissulfurimicrobium sp.]
MPTGDVRYLPALPRSFWVRAYSVTQAWEEMRSILIEEWIVLRSGDFKPLADIAEKKKRQAEKINGLERIIAALADKMLEMCGVDYGGNREGRWNALMSLTNRADSEGLGSWLTKTRLLRKEIVSMNRRHEKWVLGQAKMVDDLLGLFMEGISGARPATYDSQARVHTKGGMQGRYKLEVI